MNIMFFIFTTLSNFLYLLLTVYKFVSIVQEDEHFYAEENIN
jgi:hypothetical protein